MLKKMQEGEKKFMIVPRQPQTCSHPIYAQTLTGVFQAIRMFSPCFFMYLHPQESWRLTNYLQVPL